MLTVKLILSQNQPLELPLSKLGSMLTGPFSIDNSHASSKALSSPILKCDVSHVVPLPQASRGGHCKFVIFSRCPWEQQVGMEGQRCRLKYLLDPSVFHRHLLPEGKVFMGHKWGVSSMHLHVLAHAHLGRSHVL